MNNQQVADKVYSKFFGHLDDKEFCETKTQEILEWLDTGSKCGLRQTYNLWAEYDAFDVNREAPIVAAATILIDGKRQHLFLRRDATVFRWYHNLQDTEVSARTVTGAIAAARKAWAGSWRFRLQ